MSGQHLPPQPSPDDGSMDAHVDASEQDHRKKRRNRMTQSCLNCHNSKRKCDRKRPWCQRCVLLGLTGLCVYEVDDLADRDDANADENARLKKRVADLEYLVRQMKGKPEPRWIDHSPREDGDSHDTWSSRAGKRRAPTPDIELCPAAKSARLTPHSVKTERPTDEALLAQHHHGFADSPPLSYSEYSSVEESDLASNSSHHIGYPTATTYVHPNHPSTPPYAVQIPSSFSTLSGGLGDQPIPQSHALSTHTFSEACTTPSSQCPCRNIPTINNTYLSLSNQLQSALYNLRQHGPHHSVDSQCTLYQKIDELNKLILGRNEGGVVQPWSYENVTGSYTVESEILTPLSASSTTSYSQLPPSSGNRSPGTGAGTPPRRDWQYPAATSGVYQTYPIPEMHDRYLDYGGSSKGTIP